MVESDDKLEFTFGDDYEGESIVQVWCDGREYCPEDEAYRPRYSYTIKTPKHAYMDNDIRGGVNEQPDLNKAAASLFAFLYACQEGMPQRISEENGDLFPPEIREWAHHFSEEIGMKAFELSAGFESTESGEM